MKYGNNISTVDSGAAVERMKQVKEGAGEKYQFKKNKVVMHVMVFG